ncbi:DNRLRE domain-containing protein [Streptomyces rimosus]|uniref:DNRLRE domain-containing protein n=1 Tax=Streptomyces rimosus TaxID=1927 RepID=UPI00067C6DF4|nr:DNRLRE domain-containing protein [Streptomyces rimosus]
MTKASSTNTHQLSKAEIDKAGQAWATKHSKGGIPWALAEARKTQKKTLVPNETTPTSLTYANPDGSLTAEVTAGPERIEKDGKWVDVDATFITAADGTVKAKAHPTGLRLAAGGGTPATSIRATKSAAPRDLVTLGGQDGEQVTLKWKGGLPKPQLDGTTATYKNVVPGADVIVEATRTGFEQYTKLHQRPDGPYGYTLPLKAEGLKASGNADGSVTFTDAETGARKATMPAPMMWDASTDKVSGKHENRHRVDMRVIDHGQGDIDLVIAPDAKWLADPKTQYPVTIDPSTSALGNTFDTYVQQGETADLGAETELDWGNPGTKNPDGTARVARTLMTWNTEPFADALISSAKVEFYNTHSGNTDCKAHGWDVWNTTAGSSASRWTKQPDWLQKSATSTETKGNAQGCTDTADGWIKADVKELVQTWASAKQARSHMGIRAAEDDTKAWKVVNSRNAAANQPKLTVNFNYRPGEGTAQQAGPPFTSYSGVWGVNTLTPRLRDKFTDADGDKVNGTFQVYDAATNKPIATPAGDGLLVSDYVNPGEWATVQVPAGQLVDGKTYKFRTNAYDGTHYSLSFSPWREFVVETAAAGKPTNLQHGDSYTISDPKIVKDPKKVQEVQDVFERDGNLEAIGIKPTRGPSAPKPKAAKGIRAAWERTYTTPSTKFAGGRKPADQYEYIKDPAECSAADDADNAAGWIKNRFSYCQETLILMPAVKCGLWPPGCYLQGSFIATQTLIGQGKIGGKDRSEFTRYADFDLHLDVHWINGDFTKPGAKIQAKLPCEGTWDPGNTTAKKEEACYIGTFDGRKDSPTGWKANGDTKFDLWSSTPKLPDVAAGEQVAVGKFTPELDFSLPGYGQFIPSEGEEGQIRFDSAAYNPWAKLGSVFPDATPSLRYDKSDTSSAAYTGVEAVARHIDEARKDPDASYPKKAGKNLPGESPLHPLHRITESAGAASKERYDENEKVRKLACNENTPGAPAAGKDCDEYPFRSSTEGAARYKYEGNEYKDDFSVRYISPEENQEAGRRLGAWYHSDRILDREAFTVTIGG